MKFNILKSILPLTLLLLATVCFQSCKDKEEEEPDVILGTDEIVNVPDDNSVVNNLKLTFGKNFPLLHTPGKAEDENVYDYFSSRGYDLKVETQNNILSFDSIAGTLKPVKIGYDIVTISLDGGESRYRTVYIKTVGNIEITMNSGETTPIANIIGNKPYEKLWYDNGYTAKIYEGMLLALQPGTANIYADDFVITLTVTAYDAPAPFNWPDRPPLDKYSYVDWKKGYNLVGQKTETVNGWEYNVEIFSPFDNCNAIYVYLRNDNPSFTRIHTGKSYSESLSWLLRYYEPDVTDGKIERLKFKELDKYNTVYLYPVNADWSVFEYKIETWDPWQYKIQGK